MNVRDEKVCDAECETQKTKMNCGTGRESMAVCELISRTKSTRSPIWSSSGMITRHAKWLLRRSSGTTRNEILSPKKLDLSGKINILFFWKKKQKETQNWVCHGRRRRTGYNMFAVNVRGVRRVRHVRAKRTSSCRDRRRCRCSLARKDDNIINNRTVLIINTIN